VPEWVSSELKAKICDAAGGKNFQLDEDAAQMAAENLASVAWLTDVKIQTTHEHLLIEARWRKPVAMVKSGSQSFYVDAELVVLDFVPMPNLPIVRIEGLSATTKRRPRCSRNYINQARPDGQIRHAQQTAALRH
jgi:hypothetical protein